MPRQPLHGRSCKKLAMCSKAMVDLRMFTFLEFSREQSAPRSQLIEYHTRLKDHHFHVLPEFAKQMRGLHLAALYQG